MIEAGVLADDNELRRFHNEAEAVALPIRSWRSAGRARPFCLPQDAPWCGLHES
jgi:hypothetical protein